MVFPHGVDKECFHHFLFVYLQGEDGVHQIRIVQHHLGWLFGELLIVWINHVDESCVCEILDVVHHRGTAGLYAFSQLTDVGRLGSLYSQLVEESLYLSEVLQFYLFDEQNVHLGHHIHGFEQVLGKVALLQEEGIETMVQIVLEVFHRTYLG